jgi:hypothetical protein
VDSYNLVNQWEMEICGRVTLRDTFIGGYTRGINVSDSF